MKPLQVDAALSGQQAFPSPVAQPTGQEELEVDGLPQLLGFLIGVLKPVKEGCAARSGGAIRESVSVAATVSGLNEAVPLQALERLIDLTNVYLPRPTQGSLKAGLDSISVKRLLGQKTQDAEAKRQDPQDT